MKNPPVVDAHQHFWDPARAVYPWLTGALASIRRRFGPDDLRPALAERGVDRTILVQTRSSLEETREFLAVAASTDFVAGVTGWADLTDPDLRATVDALRSGPGGTRLVGLRHQVHDEPDPHWLLRDDVRRGLRAVEEAGLVYDFLVRTRELPAALAVAREFTGIRFVIDHIGKPPIRTGQIQEWAAAMAPFGRLTNVSCKLSGMITEADWSGWRPDDLVPYVRRAVDWFGDERLLFGSDWPVCLVAGSYAQVFDALQFALGECSSGARSKIFGANAMRVYRLQPGSR
ncbi:MAG TPA: amidohydrolase family protein [bacterium]|nr:amidohydrolase family protein [bacterium]